MSRFSLLFAVYTQPWFYRRTFTPPFPSGVRYPSFIDFHDVDRTSRLSLSRPFAHLIPGRSCYISSNTFFFWRNDWFATFRTIVGINTFGWQQNDLNFLSDYFHVSVCLSIWIALVLFLFPEYIQYIYIFWLLRVSWRKFQLRKSLNFSQIKIWLFSQIFIRCRDYFPIVVPFCRNYTNLFQNINLSTLTHKKGRHSHFLYHSNRPQFSDILLAYGNPKSDLAADIFHFARKYVWNVISK